MSFLVDQDLISVAASGQRRREKKDMDESAALNHYPPADQPKS
jgi:hypothetical protein